MRGGELVSVAHYGEKNNDPMRDPEIVFEVAAGQWQPVSIQMDYTGSCREAVFVGEDGKVFVRPAEVRDIQAFARIWDRNLQAQGFVDAAKDRDACCDNHATRRAQRPRSPVLMRSQHFSKRETTWSAKEWRVD